MRKLQEYLSKSAERHKHLCPRQVLGARMGMMAANYLSFEIPQKKKRLLTIVETDGCFVDGIEVTTGCFVGHRTMRVQDFGKVAAVFIDTETNQAFRISPKSNVREIAEDYGKGKGRWYRQLSGYQIIPLESLFKIESVDMTISIEDIVSRPGVRVNCEQCGEEIINEREVISEGLILCQSCAGYGYYCLKSA